MCTARKRKHHVDEVVEEVPAPSTDDLIHKFDRFYEKVISPKDRKNLFYEHLFNFFLLLQKDTEAKRAIGKKIDVKFLSKLLIKYTATQNEVDRNIFECLKYIERAMLVNLKCVAPLVFSTKSQSYYDNLIQYGRSLGSNLKPDEVLSYFDPELLKKTAFCMVNSEYRNEPLSDLYDPRFVLMLFLTLVKPGSELSARCFVTSNALHFCVASLSFQSDDLRALAYRIINDFNKHLNDLSAENFPQKTLLIYLIKLLKNSVTEVNERIMSPITRYICEVFDVTMDPLHPLFKGVWSALLQKPTLEMKKLPEFLKFFFSTSSISFNKERQWIMDIAALSIQCPADYMAIRQAYVAETVMAAFPSIILHRGIKLTILKFFKACLRYPTVAKDLSLRCNFPSWISFVIKHANTTRFEQVFLTQLFVHNLSHLMTFRSIVEDVLVRMTLRMAAEKVLQSINALDDDGKQKFSKVVKGFIENGDVVFEGKNEVNEVTEDAVDEQDEKKTKEKTDKTEKIKVNGIQKPKVNGDVEKVITPKLNGDTGPIKKKKAKHL